MPESNRLQIKGYSALQNEVGKSKIIEAAYAHLQSLRGPSEDSDWSLSFDLSFDLSFGFEQEAGRGL
jgi:hypothetical protein